MNELKESTDSGKNRPVTLISWRNIAKYFGKDVRTVQRWERKLGLPIRRQKGALGNSPKAPVLADIRDLELWMKSHWALRMTAKPLGSLRFSDELGRHLPSIEVQNDDSPDARSPRSKILIVDDERLIADTLAEILTMDGFKSL